MNSILKNWKTTAAGLVVAVNIFLLAKHYIDATTSVLITSIAGSLGLIAAKDGTSTGV